MELRELNLKMLFRCATKSWPEHKREKNLSGMCRMTFMLHMEFTQGYQVNYSIIMEKRYTPEITY